MINFKRVFLIVMDSVGIGHAYDAEDFGDMHQPNTLLNIDKAVGGLIVPNLEKLGIGNMDKYKKIDEHKMIKSAYACSLHEKSLGKDTMTGHWEMMGLETKKPFKTFTDTGFPKELIDELAAKTGHGIIGNCAASGTEIIKELGERQLKTKELIVYTSSDSVLQIAAHEDVIPVSELYKYCEIARELTMKDEWKVGRIIARPFIGTNKDDFKRTARRHDYALSPFKKTYLDLLKEKGLDVISIGKINDIFNGQGITEAHRTVSNEDGMNQTIDIAKNKSFKGLCFVNLVEFDSEYGHRRDPKGYAKCIESFDAQLGTLMQYITDEDLLIITADHGNDPTQEGSDHTRENVPGLFYSPKYQHGNYMGNFKTFALLGSTIAGYFGIVDKSLLNDNISSILH